MRLLIHSLLVLMVAGIAAGVALYHVHDREQSTLRALARSEVIRFQQQIHLQAALLPDSPEGTGPATVDPAWFKNDRPVNPLLGSEHPWVEVAGAPQKHLLHPPDLTAINSEVASFWYNPFAGVVRARVPVGISDAQALDLYNEINDCALTDLFFED